MIFVFLHFCNRFSNTGVIKSLLTSAKSMEDEATVLAMISRILDCNQLENDVYEKMMIGTSMLNTILRKKMSDAFIRLFLKRKFQVYPTNDMVAAIVSNRRNIHLLSLFYKNGLIKSSIDDNDNDNDMDAIKKQMTTMFDDYANIGVEDGYSNNPDPIDIDNMIIVCVRENNISLLSRIVDKLKLQKLTMVSVWENVSDKELSKMNGKELKTLNNKKQRRKVVELTHLFKMAKSKEMIEYLIDHGCVLPSLHQVLNRNKDLAKEKELVKKTKQESEKSGGVDDKYKRLRRMKLRQMKPSGTYYPNVVLRYVLDHVVTPMNDQDNKDSKENTENKEEDVQSNGNNIDTTENTFDEKEKETEAKANTKTTTIEHALSTVTSIDLLRATTKIQRRSYTVVGEMRPGLARLRLLLTHANKQDKIQFYRTFVVAQAKEHKKHNRPLFTKWIANGGSNGNDDGIDIDDKDVDGLDEVAGYEASYEDQEMIKQNFVMKIEKLMQLFMFLKLPDIALQFSSEEEKNNSKLVSRVKKCHDYLKQYRGEKTLSSTQFEIEWDIMSNKTEQFEKRVNNRIHISELSRYIQSAIKYGNYAFFEKFIDKDELLFEQFTDKEYFGAKKDYGSLSLEDYMQDITDENGMKLLLITAQKLIKMYKKLKHSTMKQLNNRHLQAIKIGGAILENVEKEIENEKKRKKLLAFDLAHFIGSIRGKALVYGKYPLLERCMNPMEEDLIETANF